MCQKLAENSKYDYLVLKMVFLHFWADFAHFRVVILVLNLKYGMIWIYEEIFYTLSIKLVYFYGVDSIKTLNTNVESQKQHFCIFRSVFVHFTAFVLIWDPYYGGDLESWENFLYVRHPYYEFLWVSILRRVNISSGPLGSPSAPLWVPICFR